MSLMRFDFLTLFPEMCATVMNESIIGRAAAAGIIESHFFNIRDYTENRQKQVDDAPFGGGMGMVMQAQPIYDCFVAARDEDERKPYVIYVSPQGKVFNQQKAVELSKKDRIVFLCGHYEGVDERVIQAIADEEVSAGDYVLTGGELPAMIVADAVSRMIPGVLADEECYIPTRAFIPDCSNILSIRGRVCGEAWRCPRCCCQDITRISAAGVMNKSL